MLKSVLKLKKLPFQKGIREKGAPVSTITLNNDGLYFNDDYFFSASTLGRHPSFWIPENNHRAHNSQVHSNAVVSQGI